MVRKARMKKFENDFDKQEILDAAAKILRDDNCECMANITTGDQDLIVVVRNDTALSVIDHIHKEHGGPSRDDLLKQLGFKKRGTVN